MIVMVKLRIPGHSKTEGAPFNRGEDDTREPHRDHYRSTDGGVFAKKRVARHACSIKTYYGVFNNNMINYAIQRHVMLPLTKLNTARRL